MERVIKILTSSMGLGTYIPSLFLYDVLEKEKYDVEIEIFESYFSDSIMDKFLESKKAYHNSYRKAVLGHKLAEYK